jgi:hypothetical protein
VRSGHYCDAHRSTMQVFLNSCLFASNILVSFQTEGMHSSKKSSRSFADKGIAKRGYVFARLSLAKFNGRPPIK